MTEIFQISNGLVTFDFLSADPDNPYHLSSYETGLAQWKGGGIFAESQLTEGSTLVFRQFAAFEDKLTIHITGNTQNEVIANARALLDILEQGARYFTHNYERQTYLQAKADNETFPRYATIVAYTWDQVPAQFGGAFVGGAIGPRKVYATVFFEIDLVLRRSMWLEQPPGNEVRCYLDSQVTYQSRNLGVPNSNTQPVMIATYLANQNITHIYRVVAATDTWSGNLMDASLPFDLFPSPLTPGDFLYIGCDGAAPNSTYLYNLVFTIGTPSLSSNNFRSQRWSGSSFFFNVTAKPFNKAGESAFCYSGGPSTPIGPANLNTIVGGNAPSVTAHWLRFFPETGASGPVPTQITRLPYSATLPYVDILSTGLAGDLDMVSKIRVVNHGDVGAAVDKVIVGRRAYSRGADFSAYINYSDAQTPAGISFEFAQSGSIFSFQDVLTFPTGRGAVATIAATQTNFSDLAGTAKMIMNSTLASQYLGKFRAFVRLASSAPSGAPVPVAQLTVGSTAAGSAFVRYPAVQFGIAASPGMVDFGIIEIPASLPRRGLDVHDLYLQVSFMTTAPWAYTVSLMDLILIPADESIMDIDARINSFTDISAGVIGHSNTLFIDKVSSPESEVDVYITNPATGGVIDKPTSGGDDGIFLERERQRLWFAVYNESNKISQLAVLEVDVSKLNRYLLPRGSI